ncbi:prepilin peptidase [Rouxiella sp. S1S-2]|uniref:prepilin peptidase n=1 Tax=Rouxiella sp. S1S-2 TaxID=2653856 RepID=UPI0012646744|nr:A24 family peptidase [Rouxiella sp. S1S-2]KAB7895004.1 prepilin peptidase [Rouxiella sp. S1S-2]
MFNDLYQLGIVHGYAFITCVILVGYLLALSVIDIERFQLPDRLTLSLLWVGLMLHALFTPQFLASSVIGAAAGYFFLWAIYWLVKLVIKKEGLGYGDFKLMAALGAWLGWECLPWVAVYASITGIIVFFLRFCFNRNKGEIPFGPFLAAAGGIIYISQQMNSLADPRCIFCVTFK